MENTECTLCGQQIRSYSPELHHLKIDDKHEVRICSDCMQKIVDWQGKKYAKLFPTSTLKKRYNK